MNSRPETPEEKVEKNPHEILEAVEKESLSSRRRIQTVQQKSPAEKIIDRLTKKSPPKKKYLDPDIDPEIEKLIQSQKRFSAIKSISKLNNIADLVTMQALGHE